MIATLGNSQAAKTIDKKMVIDLVITALAKVDACSAEEMLRKTEHDGYVISAKVAMFVAVTIEEHLGRGEFLHPADFSSDANCSKAKRVNACDNPAEQTTIGRIVEIIMSKCNC